MDERAMTKMDSIEHSDRQMGWTADGSQFIDGAKDLHRVISLGATHP